MYDILKKKKENQLYTKYYSQINSYFSKYGKIYDEHIINELSNDVFMKLNKNITKLDSQDDGIKKWLFTICKNIRIDHDRKRTVESRKKYTLINDIGKNDFENSIEDNILLEDGIKSKLENYDSLTKKILLFKIHGYKNNEISNILNISERKITRNLNKIKDVNK